MLVNKVISLNRTAEIITWFIAFLWFYAAASKLIEFQHFNDAMHKQPFPKYFITILIYGLPAAEILTGIMLSFSKTKLTGLYISAAMFSAFTAYITLILNRFFGHIPCSCGGLIETMGWSFHLWFNIGFLFLTIFSIYIHIKKERSAVTERKQF